MNTIERVSIRYDRAYANIVAVGKALSRATERDDKLEIKRLRALYSDAQGELSSAGATVHAVHRFPPIV